MPHRDPLKAKEYFKKYNVLNFEKRRQQRLAKRDEHIKYCKEWRKNNQERIIKYNKKIYADNKESILKNSKSRRENNLEKYLIRENKYRMKNPIKVKHSKRAYNLKVTYNITLEDYQRMFDTQKGKCAICKKHQNEFKYTLHVDHDHGTGKVRGLLCGKCNAGLGYYEKSDIKEFDKYLNNHRKELN